MFRGLIVFPQILRGAYLKAGRQPIRWFVRLFSARGSFPGIFLQ